MAETTDFGSIIPIKIVDKKNIVTKEAQKIKISASQENKLVIDSLEDGEQFVVRFVDDKTVLEVNNKGGKFDYLKPAMEEKEESLYFELSSVAISPKGNLLFNIDDDSKKFDSIEINGKEVVLRRGKEKIITSPVATQNITFPKNLFDLLANDKVMAKELPSQVFDILSKINPENVCVQKIGSNKLKLAKVSFEDKKIPTKYYYVQKDKMREFHQSDAYTYEDSASHSFGIKVRPKTSKKVADEYIDFLEIRDLSTGQISEIKNFIGISDSDEKFNLTKEVYDGQILKPTLLSSIGYAKKSFKDYEFQATPPQNTENKEASPETDKNKKEEKSETPANKEVKKSEPDKITVDLTPFFKISGLFLALFGLFSGFGAALWMIMALGVGGLGWSHESVLSKVIVGEFSPKKTEKKRLENLGRAGILASKVLDALTQGQETNIGLVNQLLQNIEQKIEQTTTIYNSKEKSLSAPQKQEYNKKIAELNAIKNSILEMRGDAETVINSAIEKFNKLDAAQRTSISDIEKMRAEIEELDSHLSKLKVSLEALNKTQTEIEQKQNTAKTQEEKLVANKEKEVVDIKINRAKEEQEEKEKAKVKKEEELKEIHPEQQVNTRSQGLLLIDILKDTFKKMQDATDEFNQVSESLDNDILKTEGFTPIETDFGRAELTF